MTEVTPSVGRGEGDVSRPLVRLWGWTGVQCGGVVCLGDPWALIQRLLSNGQRPS
jgi:hypothetical protein